MKTGCARRNAGLSNGTGAVYTSLSSRELHSIQVYSDWRTELIDSSREAIPKAYCNRPQKLKNTSRTVVQTPCSKNNANEYLCKPAFAQRPGMVHEQSWTQHETKQWTRVAVQNGIGHTNSLALSLNKNCTKSRSILNNIFFSSEHQVYMIRVHKFTGKEDNMEKTKHFLSQFKNVYQLKIHRTNYFKFIMLLEIFLHSFLNKFIWVRFPKEYVSVG